MKIIISEPFMVQVLLTFCSSQKPLAPGICFRILYFIFTLNIGNISLCVGFRISQRLALLRLQCEFEMSVSSE